MKGGHITRLLLVASAVLLLLLSTYVAGADGRRRKKKNKNNVLFSAGGPSASPNFNSNSNFNSDDAVAEKDISEIQYKDDKDLQRKIDDLSRAKFSSNPSDHENDVSELQMAQYRSDERSLQKDVYRAALHHGEDSIEKATALHKLGRNFFLQRRFGESFSIAKEIVRIHQIVDGVDHINTANAFGNMGAVAYRLSNVEACEYAMNRAMYIFVRKYGKDSKEVLLHRGKMLTFHIDDAENTMGVPYDESDDVLDEL